MEEKMEQLKIGEPVNEANGHLIAAAPELLRALKELADWPYNSYCFDGSKAKNAAESLANARRFARETIAKTEGR